MHDMRGDVNFVIKRCLEDDKTSWDVFVLEYASLALNILNTGFSALESQEKTDIVLNVFARLIDDGLENYRGTTKYEFLVYFAAIVRNEAQSYLLGVNKSLELLQTDDSDYPEEVADASSAPDIKVIRRKEMLNLIHMVLAGFPLGEQALFFLKLRGHKDKDIAAITGTHAAGVPSKYFSVIKKIRKVLGLLRLHGLKKFKNSL